MHHLSYNPITKAEGPQRERRSLAVIGHLTIDSITYPDHQIETSPGGSAAAVATAAVQLGIDTSLFSRVGTDFPKDWLTVLDSLGINITGIDFTEKEDSLRIDYRYLSREEVESIECNNIEYTNLDLKNVPRADCIHICPLRPEDQIEILKGLKGKTGILSTSFSELFKEDYEKKNIFDSIPWKDVDIIFVNETEARVLTREREVEKAVGRFVDSGAGSAVITLGGKGSLICRGGEISQVDARKVEIVDTTGCGDSYIGGFLGEYLKNRDVLKAAGMGTYLASLTAQKKGSWAGLVSDVGVRF